MTENRFERTYQEYKREKEQTRVSSRFDCLRSEPLRPSPIRESAGRFECLRESNYQTPPISYRENSRFECLVDDYYPRWEPEKAPIRDTIVYLPKPEPPKPPMVITPPKPPPGPVYLPKPEPPKESVTYLPKPEPPKLIEPTEAKPKAEPWRRGGQPKKKDEVVGDINYHFPALGCSRGELPKSEIKLPESRAPIEMIVKPIVIPSNKKVMTMMCFKDGKVVSKEVYEDGTDLPDDNAPVIIKRPKYTSWASVLKKDEEDIENENRGWG